jgi:hypothetical protein
MPSNTLDSIDLDRLRDITGGTDWHRVSNGVLQGSVWGFWSGALIGGAVTPGFPAGPAVAGSIGMAIGGGVGGVREYRKQQHK